MKILLTALVSLLTVTAAAAQTPQTGLRSPWDLHPPRPTAGTYTCPAPLDLPRDITLSGYYTDPQSSVPDPARYQAYEAAAAPFHRVMDQAEAAADTWLATGAPGAASCTLRILDRAAGQHALTGAMSSNQAHYVQGWTLGALAVTYLKVRTSSAGSPRERARIVAWLVQVANATRAYFAVEEAADKGDGLNNHLYWAGFAVMATAIAADNHDLYRWATQAYVTGTRNVRPDGSLPLEMARGSRALHYHLFAAAPLVMMAEFGAANGQDFYDSDNRALRRLVNRCISGLYSSQWFAQNVGVPQQAPGPQFTAQDVAWLRPYLARFPDPGPEAILSQMPSLSYEYLGGIPPK